MQPALVDISKDPKDPAAFAAIAEQVDQILGIQSEEIHASTATVKVYRSGEAERKTLQNVRVLRWDRAIDPYTPVCIDLICALGTALRQGQIALVEAIAL